MDGRPVTAVEVSAPAFLLEAAGAPTSLAVWTCWRYHPTDPYAVTLAFKESRNDTDEVPWLFARDLLHTGLSARTTEGADVVVWPQQSMVLLRFTSPDGTMVIQVNRTVVEEFLGRTYAWVPRGDEDQFLNVDAGLRRLLTEAEG